MSTPANKVMTEDTQLVPDNSEEAKISRATLCCLTLGLFSGAAVGAFTGGAIATVASASVAKFTTGGAIGGALGGAGSAAICLGGNKGQQNDTVNEDSSSPEFRM